MGPKKETRDILRTIYGALIKFSTFLGHWLFKDISLSLCIWILHCVRYMPYIVYNIYFAPCLYSVLPLTLWLAFLSN
jgi:hypothetical protein